MTCQIYKIEVPVCQINVLDAWISLFVLIHKTPYLAGLKDDHQTICQKGNPIFGFVFTACVCKLISWGQHFIFICSLLFIYHISTEAHAEDLP